MTAPAPDGLAPGLTGRLVDELDRFLVELNSIEPVESRCRLNFVIGNTPTLIGASRLTAGAAGFSAFRYAHATT